MVAHTVFGTVAVSAAALDFIIGTPHTTIAGLAIAAIALYHFGKATRLRRTTTSSTQEH